MLRETEEFIEDNLKRFPNCYVACSFGKDSSVLLDLVLRAKNDVPVRFFTTRYTFIIDNYEEILEWWKQKYDVRIEYVTGEKYNEKYGEVKGFKTRKKLQWSLNNCEYDAFFVGIRKEESSQRRISLNKYGKVHYMKTFQKWRLAPLSDWNLFDVWAYIITNKIPVLETYKRLGDDTRTTAGICTRAVQEGVQRIKKVSLANFNKVCLMKPEIKGYG
ncbi:MAG: phosphoadenosine phosphosulfate reductase family protein [Ignavibacteria bacterium]|nr:phosphoadenosine phosphosulfate reductase family protein [Ignavibacteria bacterium]